MDKPKILVVDDDKAITESMQEVLSAEGFDVVTAENGSQGLAVALNQKPQLILTDMEMPVLNGMDMLSELRKSDDWGKKVPVIILTNFDTNDAIMQGIVKNEPSFYILKSKVKPDAVAEIIREKLKSVADKGL